MARASRHRAGMAPELVEQPRRGRGGSGNEVRALPWVMAQTWEDVLFAHWPVAHATLERLLPPGLPLDTHGGRAFVGVVPFRVTGLRARFLPPVPGLSAFPEVNVRTYVKIGGAPAVWFFSLDANNAPAVLAARLLYRLPYFRARMRMGRDGGATTFASRRDGPAEAAFVARYAPAGHPAEARPGSLDEFLTERRVLVTEHRGRLLRADVEHAPWPLQPATADLHEQTLTRAAGIELPEQAPMLHYARRIDVRFQPLAPAR